MKINNENKELLRAAENLETLHYVRKELNKEDNGFLTDNLKNLMKLVKLDLEEFMAKED